MSAAPTVMQVAREFSDIVGTGGVGDVGIQLAIMCDRQGWQSVVVVPYYGSMEVSDEYIADNGTCERIKIPMSYRHGDGREEDVTLYFVDLEIADVVLKACLIDAKRYRGKQKPYVYTAPEAETWRSLQIEPEFCGAERPPSDTEIKAGAGHYDFFAMNVLLQKAALEAAILLDLEDPVFHVHDCHTAPLGILRQVPRYAAYRTSKVIATLHNCGQAYRQRCGDIPYVAAVLGVNENVIRRCMIDGEFDPAAAAILFCNHANTVSEGYAWEIEVSRMETSGGDPDLRP